MIEEKHPRGSRVSRVIALLGVLSVTYGVSMIFLRVFVLFLLETSPRPVRYSLLAFAASSAVDLLLQASFILGGVGLLAAKAWGRTVSLYSAILNVAFIILLASHFFVGLVVGRGDAGSQPWLGVSLTALSALIRLLYPILLIVLLNYRSIKRCLQPA